MLDRWNKDDTDETNCVIRASSKQVSRQNKCKCRAFVDRSWAQKVILPKIELNHAHFCFFDTPVCNSLWQ